MNRIKISDRERNDAGEIWLYIAQDNIPAADRRADKFTDQYANLLRFPGMDRMRDELRPGMRSWPVGTYLIFYRAIDSGIEIIRVLHGARDIPKIFEESTAEPE